MSVLKRMTEDELKTFVVDYCDGKIFTSAECGTVGEVGRCFPVVRFMKEEDLEKLQEEAEDVACFWEYTDKAGPMSINGKPSFFSCRIMHKDDWERCSKAIDKELERRKNIEV